MNSYTVVFAPEAEAQLTELYFYVAERASAATALRYTKAIVDYCVTFEAFPYRGAQRDDIRPGLRITNFKKNVVIAFTIDETVAVVTIIGIFYGGRNFIPALRGDAES
ncbi:plasmid stabilization system protein ParE [Duganella sp. SG902]|uniref:type II toxin-antitoxin system RelE/ParE family toxin n=1 Tax=Duganella sp. SG902 TaxID=2587016 RepID=UPI00159D4F0E|nr:type II toxin-antitoxin system RelE/ParE family toxin [Duganella sp. SG902]NVM77287.1 plasmid stabilization system protein ParE [Duganella sp. SG902]